MEEEEFEVGDIVEFTGDSCGLDFVRAEVVGVSDDDCSVEFFTKETRLTVKRVPKINLQRV